MPVIRELILGPKRFSDLRAALPGISANVLTQRLEELEVGAIVVRRRLPPPASVQVYDLTDWGRESEILFQVIGRWAARSPTMRPGMPMSVSSVILSMRTMIARDRIGDRRAVIGFRFGEEHFRAVMADGDMQLDRGPADDADAIFTGDQNALVAALYAAAPLEALDGLRVEGDAALARWFTSLFPLPPKAPAAGTA